mgnify:CR=1 FL=1
MNQNLLPTVFLVDDSPEVQASLQRLIQMSGLSTETFSSAEEFLERWQADAIGCLILDLKMPGMSGIELQAELERRGIELPIIFLTAHGDIQTTVKAVQAGAIDFLTKPVEPLELLKRVQIAILQSVRRHERQLITGESERSLVSLSARELEIAKLLAAGCTNKDIALKLQLSPRTVENHRARIMDKTRSANLLELAKLVQAL